MSSEILTLAAAAATIGVMHTLAGPDHYIPFIAMARVGRWSLARALSVTALCGVGHVLGSIALGALGAALGVMLERLEWLEGLRGDLAAWMLLGFGLAYMTWGVRQALRNRPHAHLHVHEDGTIHTHSHGHHGAHAHVHVHLPENALVHSHSNPQSAVATLEPTPSLTPWVLFTIFVFGPCEPLIPLLMYPAAQLSVGGVALVAGIFAVCTIATMLMLVMAGYVGLGMLRVNLLARFSHALAGAALSLCGGAMLAGL